MSISPERGELSKLLSSSQLGEPRVVNCVSSEVGKAFLATFSGARLSGLTILRYSQNDVIAFTTKDRRAMTVIAEKDAFIAIELHGQELDKRGNLAFREDISHKRLFLALGATYQDPSLVRGEIIPLDPRSEFSQLLFDQEAIVDEARPSWYTEDWVTIRLVDGRSIVIRADRNKIKGAISVKPSGTGYMNIGSHRVDNLRLDDPSKTVIPSKFLPSSKK